MTEIAAPLLFPLFYGLSRRSTEEPKETLCRPPAVSFTVEQKKVMDDSTFDRIFAGSFYNIPKVGRRGIRLRLLGLTFPT